MLCSLMVVLACLCEYDAVMWRTDWYAGYGIILHSPQLASLTRTVGRAGLR